MKMTVLEKLTRERARAVRFTRVQIPALVLIAAACLMTGRAAAQPQDRSVWDRTFVGELSFGVGTPTGVAGVHGELRVASPLALRFGLGVGAMSDPQGAAMLRLRLPQLPALNLGAGLAAGSYGVVCIFCDREQQPYWALAYWNNYELSLEARTSRGVMLRAFGGAAVLLNRDGYACTSGCDEADVRAIAAALPYFGVGLGVVLDAQPRARSGEAD